MRLAFVAFFALAVLAAPLIHADSLADELSGYSAGLDAVVAIENADLVASPQVILVKITATNPFDSAMPLYVLRQGDSGWEVVKLLGALPAKTKSSVELEVEAAYDKQTKSKTRYAVVGRAADGQLYGTSFEIVKDWSRYEAEINDTLSSAMLAYVPLVGGLLVLLVAFLARTAYKSKSLGLDENEYTMKTLVFPQVAGRPFEEKIADMMMHPVILAFEGALVLLLVFLIFESMAGESGADQALNVLLLSGLGAAFVPLVYFAAAWYLDKREEGKPLRFFVAMFMWGMFAAFLSLIISSAILSEYRYAIALPFAVIATMIVAPIVEETLKALGVLFMSGHHEYNDTLTGLLLGFTTGAGFAFVENWFYFSAKANPFDLGLSGWVALILYRSFFNTLAHGCFTATVSTLIGYLRGMGRFRRLARLAFAPGIFLAAAIHVIFNLSAIADSFVVAQRESLFFVFNPMLIILMAAMFFLVLVLAIIDEKKRSIANRTATAWL